MAEWSRRAARRPARGGLPNALFVVAAAERPPAELTGIADELTINFPWGSLLAGTLAIDPAVAAGIAWLVASGGHIRGLVSVLDDDRLGLPRLSADDPPALAKRWACHGFQLSSFRPATQAEVDQSRSSWARRLAAGRRRPTWRIELVKASGARAAGAPTGTDAVASARPSG
jgi:16S rRNA (adenine(1408)-N(1))-methyltransferase